jgi:hypothetical protein
MQVTGLRTGQPAFNRGFLGALLAVFVAAALVALLIVGTVTRTPVGLLVTPDAGLDVAARAEIEFRALEPAAYAAMLKEAQERAFSQFRSDERAVLTPAQAAANQREAVRKLHVTERAEKSSAANSHGAGGPGSYGK